MNFVALLTSLDDLLFEVMSWLVFFPITLWRVLCRPLAMMSYAEEQLLLDADHQYRGTVSPPIMLILTIVLVQGFGLTVNGGANAILADRHGLAGLVNDNTTLFLLRLVLFGLFALVLATRRVRRSGVVLDRDTLKPPFYAQSFAISPFALLLSGGVTMLTNPSTLLRGVGVVAVVAAFVFYGVVQVRWFSRELNQSHLRSFVDASLGMIVSIGLTIGLGLLFH